MSKKEDVDKLVRTIEDFGEVYSDYKRAKEDDDKVSFMEWVTVVGGPNVGKVTRFVSAIGEIKDEILDFESDEGKEVWEAFKQVYDPANPYIDEGIEKILEGMLKLKEGITLLLQAKEWEKEKK